VLLRGPNNPMMAACWLAVMKAGGVCVGTMPLLRAKELTDIVTKAQVSLALCDTLLSAELEAALPGCPTLQAVRYWSDGSSNSLDTLIERQSIEFENVDTAADDVALIAFTSGTTWQAERHDALPSRRDRDVRLLPALVPEAGCRRRLRRHAAACVHVRPRRAALLSDALRRLDRAAREAHARGAARCDRPFQGDDRLHRADHVPRDGDAAEGAGPQVRHRLAREVRSRRAKRCRMRPASSSSKRAGSRSSTASARPR
jgi:hypothetical protein